MIFNTVFKIKCKLYIASGLCPLPHMKISGCAPGSSYNYVRLATRERTNVK